jgi:hypothetical protein
LHALELRECFFALCFVPACAGLRSGVGRSHKRILSIELVEINGYTLRMIQNVAIGECR